MMIKGIFSLYFDAAPWVWRTIAHLKLKGDKSHETQIFKKKIVPEQKNNCSPVQRPGKENPGRRER
jgi:hypothetical protein